MERIVTATQANREFSRILGEVAEGHTYVVTSRGRRVARIEPAPDRESEAERRRKDQAWAALLARLRSQPAMNLSEWKREDGYE